MKRFIRRHATPVVTGITAMLVVLATLFGTVDEWPQEMRALIQAAGSLAGVYCGYSLQKSEENHKSAAESSKRFGITRAAMSGLFAIAATIQHALNLNTRQRERLGDGDFKNIASLSLFCETILDTHDSTLRAILSQVGSSAEAWEAIAPEAGSLRSTGAESQATSSTPDESGERV